MLKKIISVCLIVAMIFGIFASRDKLSLQKQIKKYCDSTASRAGSVLLYDLDTSKILYSKKTDEKISVGSIVKLLSILVADRYFKPDDIINVGSEVDLNVAADASRSMIRDGQTLTYKQLLTAILLPSGCDATITLAVNTAKKITGNDTMSDSDCVQLFVEAINNYAGDLGCKNSKFINPDGQDAEGQYTCLSDVLLIIKDAMKNKSIMELTDKYASKETLISGDVYDWKNTNRLINPDDTFYYQYAHGLKTGYSLNSGYCITSYAEKDGHKILGIVCGCKTEDARYQVISNLFKLCFINLENK